MSYSITRRDFMKRAGVVIALTTGTLMLGGCGSSSGGQVSGNTGEDGEKIITTEIKTQVGKEELVDRYNSTKYTIKMYSKMK